MEDLDQEIKEAYNAARISEATFEGHCKFIIERSDDGESFTGSEIIKGVIGFSAVVLAKIIIKIRLQSNSINSFDDEKFIKDFCDHLKYSIGKALMLESSHEKGECKVH